MSGESATDVQVRDQNSRRVHVQGFFGTIVASTVVELLAFSATTFLLVSIGVEFFASPHSFLRLPFDVIGTSLFATACSSIMLVGNGGAFFRARWSRSLVRAGSAGQIVIGVVGFLFLFLHLKSLTAFGFLIVLIGLARMAWDAWAYLLFTGASGDFYFGAIVPRDPARLFAPDGLGDSAASVAQATSLTDDSVQAAKTVKPFPPADDRFVIEGFDVQTGLPVSFTSRAPTAEKAAKAAVVMGMDPGRLTVKPVEPRP